MSTDVVTATKFRSNFSTTLDSTDDGSIVIVKRRGKLKREKALVDLDTLEDLLAASDPEYLKSIADARQQMDSGEAYSFSDVFGHLED